MKKIVSGVFFLILTLASAVWAEERTVGETAPDFSLADIDGQTRALSEFKGKYVVLEWTNPDCPFVKKYYDAGHMQNLQKTYTAQGIVWLSVNSSAEGKQGHYSADEWKKIRADQAIGSTAILLDPDGKAGRAYGAKTTPHLYVVDPTGNLIYQGAIDSLASTDTSDIAKATNYVVQALDEALSGKPVSEPVTKPYGCSVKY